MVTGLTPTVIVGVGKAGISVLKRLHQSNGHEWGGKYDTSFEYVAVDTDTHELHIAPNEANTVQLDTPSRKRKTDTQAYPYLAEELHFIEKGTARQCPIGRYKLDDEANWNKTAKTIRTAVTNVANGVKNNSDIDVQQLNIVHVHSLAGGTGSGTFPLIAHLLQNTAENVENTHNVTTYVGGIGLCPELPRDINQETPPGDPRHYANASAALKTSKLSSGPRPIIPYRSTATQRQQT